MSIFQDYIKPTLVLTAICVAISGALVYTEGVTAPIIAAAELEKAEKARTEVLPMAEGFTKYEEVLPEGVQELYHANNDVGVTVTTSSRGYGGEVVMMFGISNEGKLVNLKVLNDQETPGIGSKVLSDSYFQNILGTDSNLEGVDSVTGATLTSKAVANNLKLAFETFRAFSSGTLAESVDAMAQEELQMLENARAEVLPMAEGFTLYEGELPTGINEIYRSNNEVGMVIVTSSAGHAGEVVMMFGLSQDGKLVNLKVLKNQETPDVGGKVLADEHLQGMVGLDSSAEGVDGIAGATGTSKAVDRNVKLAFDAFQLISEGGK